ncbi:hypothetical protein NHN26_11780 [Rhodovulum tesquicola]|uniref:Uncharacterized protein n=1 Tax=Rhodovulum steppense TaxID=540251 RepID=A0A4R1YWC8_9RHOB|nr:MULTISPECIES: hypothetical protein [Rhodovulum]MCO8145905.1 hypothetical protein [Rhodovulum tesquicola]TCM85460.1 hypothetical protein EV216_10734 [Rhodovulum steppense]
MTKKKEYDWVVDVLIDLNGFCENEGLDDVSRRLAAAIEEIAPLLRTPPTSSAQAAASAPRTARRLHLVKP